MPQQKVRRVIKYIGHALRAKNTGGFGLHSPYLFNFGRNMLSNKHPFYIFKKIEKKRDELRCDNRLIKTTDFGTSDSKQIKISNIAKQSIQKKKYAQLFFRIIYEYRFTNVLELGTSLGITTAYLSSPSKNINCFTLEGCPEISKIAKKTLEDLGIDNVNQVSGKIDQTLAPTLQTLKQVDFVYFDANHTYEATIKYFNQCLEHITPKSIFAFDDIYWSKEMENAWKNICAHPRVTASIDTFGVGFVFFDDYLKKKHYRILF